MGPTWVPSAPDVPHVGPMNLASRAVEQNISLFHDNKVVNDPVKVCYIFNNYFIEVASHIGKEDPIQDDESIDDILCSSKESSVLYPLFLI